MEIHKTISKWYEETQEGIDGKIGPDVCNADEIDKLCLCIIRTSSQYCAATLQLLNSGFEYPAKALMRCLGELNIKFTWSLVGCKNDKSSTSEEVKKRFQRWRKAACFKGVQLLEDCEAGIRPEDKKMHEKF